MYSSDIIRTRSDYLRGKTAKVGIGDIELNIVLTTVHLRIQALFGLSL